MAYGVKIKFGFGQKTTVELSHQDGFIFKVRACEEFSKGTDNAASAAREHGVGLFAECRCVVLGEVAPTVELVAAQYEAAAFRRNVLHGGGPGRAMVRSRRAVNFNPLGIHKSTQERHVVFPADYRAEL